VIGSSSLNLGTAYFMRKPLPPRTRIVLTVGSNLYLNQVISHLDLNPNFYARKQLLLSARLNHHNSVRPSVRLSVTRVDQSKAVQARIITSSPSGAWKILVSGTVKLFHKFESGYPKRGR